jgi:hypothetical protein
MIRLESSGSDCPMGMSFRGKALIRPILLLKIHPGFRYFPGCWLKNIVVESKKLRS